MQSLSAFFESETSSLATVSSGSDAQTAPAAEIISGIDELEQFFAQQLSRSGCERSAADAKADDAGRTSDQIVEDAVGDLMGFVRSLLTRAQGNEQGDDKRATPPREGFGSGCNDSTPLQPGGSSFGGGTIDGGTGRPLQDSNRNRDGTQLQVVINPSMSPSDLAKVREAMDRWEAISDEALEFVEVSLDAAQRSGVDFMQIDSTPDDGTPIAGVADVGASPDGQTSVTFEIGQSLSVVMHEIGHGLGLRHDQGVMAPVNPNLQVTAETDRQLDQLYA